MVSLGRYYLYSWKFLLLVIMMVFRGRCFVVQLVQIRMSY
jgi:hypothetical protein